MVVKYLTKTRWKLLGRAEVHVHPGLDVLQLFELLVHPLLQNPERTSILISWQIISDGSSWSPSWWKRLMGIFEGKDSCNNTGLYLQVIDQLVCVGHSALTLQVFVRILFPFYAQWTILICWLIKWLTEHYLSCLKANTFFTTTRAPILLYTRAFSEWRTTFVLSTKLAQSFSEVGILTSSPYLACHAWL